jgi:16S rRNA (cytidine1402-2'-O)-methyltransferase
MNLRARGGGSTGAGKLVICPTPLGNLKDITLRTLEVLRTADVIFAEDTRVTKRLLRAYDIRGRVISFHQRVAHARLRELTELLTAGATVAVVSDAGMPGISDPGSELVRVARGIEAAVEVLPGPTAVPAALVLSGFDISRFRFDGFPPRKPGERAAYLASLKNERAAVVWFESPARIGALLRALAVTLPQRRVFVLREYTKKFEEHLLGSPGDVLQRLRTPLRGEVTLVLEGAARSAPSAATNVMGALELLIRAGVSVKDAVEAVRRASGAPRNDVYQLALSVKRR